MKRGGAVAAGMFMLAACNQGRSNSVQPADVTRREAVPPIPPPGTGPDARTPLGRPENAVDPKSPEAAYGLVEQYCDLLKAGQYLEAHHLWSGDASTDDEFAQRWTGYGKLDRCSIARPGALEGAAGSIYTTVAVEFFFRGGLVKRSGSLTLRRVNDVPGSSQEERRWHIVKADLQPVD